MAGYRFTVDVAKSIPSKAKAGDYTKPNKHKKEESKAAPTGNAPIGQTFQREVKQGKYSQKTDTSRSALPSMSDVLTAGMQTVRNTLISQSNQSGYNFNIQNKNILKVGQLPEVNLLGGKQDYKTPSDRYSANGLKLYSSPYVGQGNKVADFLHDMEFGRNNSGVLKQVAYSKGQVPKSDDTEGEFGKAFKLFERYQNGEFSHFNSEKEYNAWKKEYDDWAKNYNADVYDTTAPPLGYTKDGKKVNRKEWENAFRLVQAKAYNDKLLEEQQKKQNKKLKEMTADYSDNNAVNSIADALITSSQSNKELNKGLGGTRFGGVTVGKTPYNKHNILKELWQYHTDYVFKPIINGEYKVLLNNALVNLGETLDLTAKGTKGFLYGTQGVYGKKNGMSQLDNPETQWVYTGGSKLSSKERKSVQKKLIDLGILDYINGSGGMHLGGGFDQEHKDLKTFLREAGISGTERKQLLKEAGYFVRSFQKYKEGNTSAGSLKGFTKAYSTKEHYDVDTGNVTADLVIEMVSDPSILLGAAAGIGKSAFRGTVSNVVKDELESVVKNLDEAVVLDKNLKKHAVVEHYTKEYGRMFSDDLMHKSSLDLSRDINLFAADLERKGLVDEAQGIGIKYSLEKSINDSLDNYHFKMIRSLKNLESVADQVDRVFLKSVFSVPYATYKIGVKPVAHKINMASLLGRFKTRRAVGRIRNAVANPVTKNLDVFSLEAVEERKMSEAVMDDLNASRKVDQEIYAHTSQVISGLGDVVSRNVRPGSLKLELDNYVKTMYGDFSESFDDFYNYLKDGPLSYKRDMRELFNELDKVKNRASDIINKNQIDINSNILYNLKAEPAEYDKHFVDSFEETINTQFNSITDSYIKKQVNDVYIQSKLIDDIDQRGTFIKDSIERIEKDYHSKNPFYGKRLVGKVEDKFEDSAKAIQNKVKMPAFNSRNDALGVATNNFFRRWCELKFKPSTSFKRLANYMESAGVQIKYTKEVSDDLGYIENFLELNGTEYISFQDFRKKVVDDFADDYVYPESVYTAKDLISDARMSKEEFYSKIRRRDSASFWQYHSKRKELNSKIGKLYKEFLFKRKIYKPSAIVNGIENLNQVEVQDMLREGIESIQEKIRIKEGLSLPLTKTDRYDLKTLYYARDLEQELRRFNEASIVLDAEKDFVQVHEDTAHALFRILKDTSVRDVLSFSDSKNLFGKYGVTLENTFVPVMGIDVKSLGLSKEKAQRVEHVIRSAYLFSDLVSKLDNFVNFNSLVDRLSNNNVALSPEKQIAIVETLFGSQSKIASNYIDVNGSYMDNLVNRTNAYMMARHGGDRVALDSFRKQVTDFDGELWQSMRKRYGEAIDDPAVRERVTKICEGGHLDPADDVRVTLLQAVVRDENFISDMNYYSEIQPVYLVDIETMGLSAERSDVTAISAFRWNAFDDEGDLNKLLDYIEDSENIKNYHSYMPEKYIREEMSPETLEQLYREDPILKSHHSRMEDYIKHYGAEANKREVVLEKDILSEWMKELDNSAAEMGDAVPKLVVHNTNNFDLDFIYRRCSDKDYQIYLQHIDSWRDVDRESVNVLSRLVGLQGDFMLTGNQERFVRELVADYADKVPSKGLMRPFEFEKAYKDVKELIGILEQVQEYGSIKNRASKVISELPNDAKILNDMLADEDLLKELYRLHENFERMGKVLFERDNLDYLYLWNKLNDNTFDSYKHNSLVREINAEAEDGLYRFGYDKSYEAKNVMRFFRVSGDELIYSNLKKMNELARSIIYDSTSRMIRNEVVHMEEVKEVCYQIIDFVVKKANTYDYYDPLYYLKYLVAPEDDYELFALAKRLYDEFAGSFDIKSYFNTFGQDAVPKNFKQRKNFLKGLKGSEEFYAEFAANDEIKNLFENANSLHDIYIDAPMDVGIKYQTIPTESSLFYNSIANGIANKTYNLDAIEKSSIGETLTATHNTKIALQLNTMHEATDLFRALGNLPDAEGEAVRRCLSEGNKELYRQMRNAYDIQILDYVSQSEDNLISHLLHNNQILVVPFKGNNLHKQLFNDLRELLQTVDTTKVRSFEKNNYLFISIDKRWEKSIQIEKDALSDLEPPVMYFGDSSKGYLPPQYKPLSIDRESFYATVYGSLEDVIKTMEASGKHFKDDASDIIRRDLNDFVDRVLDYREHFDEHMANLTGGKSIGSLGFLHNENIQRDIWANIPEEFRRQIVSMDFAVNDRFFHNPSCQMSLLGDADNCWHVGAVDVEETDVFFGTYDTLRRTAERVSVEALAIDSIFNKANPLNINTIFAGVNDSEAVKAIQDNPDVAVFVMVEAKTDTGYRVDLLDIKSVDDLQQAKEMNAVIYSYKEFLDIREALNKNTQSGTFWKWWSRLANMHKVVALIKPMTAVRNALDAYCKGVIETGDAPAYTKNLVKAVQLIKAYNDVNKVIFEQRGLYHATMKDIENNWETLIKREGKGKDIALDFETYCMLDGWLSTGRAGGESKQLLEIKKKAKRKLDWRHVTKSDVSGRDIISSDLEKFKQLSTESAGGIYDKVLTDAEKQILDRETFLAIHSGEVNVPTVLISKYDRLVDSIVMNFKNDRLTFEGAKGSLGIVYQNANNGALAMMSAPEEVVRLAQYLTLADQGFSESAIHRSVVMSQYDTSIKNQAEKIIETLIPFFSFTKANVFYWAGLIDRNPHAFRMLNHIFSQYSWNFDNFDYDSHYDREQMLNGNINAEVFNEWLPEGLLDDKELDGWFRLQPSFMDAFNFVWGPIGNLANSLYSPLRGALGEAYFSSGIDLKAVFGSDFMEDWNYKTLKTKVSDSLPVYSIARKYVENPLSLIATGLKFNKKSFEMNSFQIFLQNLEEHGKWYDHNLGKIVDLSQKNDYALNAKGLTWDEIKHYNLLFNNKLFDNNAGEFVPVNEYRLGGLNKDWDFSKEGEWDEFVKLYYRYRGKKWDANQREFVDPKDYIPGGLNRKWDFTIPGEWDKFLAVREQFFPNEKWDANQGKFVLKDYYIPGGLNSKNLTWSQVCALKDALMGEEWNSEEHRWVKTHKPTVKVDAEEFERHQADFIDGMSKVDSSKHSKDFMERLVDKVYAESGSKVLAGMSKIYALTKTGNSPNLTGNPENDARVLAEIIANAPKFERQWGRGWDYYSGRADGVTYRGKSYLPRRSGAVRVYNNVKKGFAPKAYSKFADPFSFNNDNNTLYIATGGESAYKAYYNYEYNKLYNYKGTKDLLAHYPLRGGNRSNNRYNVNVYYQGIYNATKHKGLGTTIRNNLKLQSKLRMYQH